MENSIELITSEGRLKTFKKFPKIKGAPLCNPSNFSKAGFFNYSSRNAKDLVKCFACDKELANWEEGDDPWQEHVKRGAECPFVAFRSLKEPTLDDFLTLYFKICTLKIQRNVDGMKSFIQSEFEDTMKGIPKD